jgi:hypothetical protein
MRRCSLKLVISLANNLPNALFAKANKFPVDSFAKANNFPVDSFAKANKFDVLHLKAHFPPEGIVAGASSQLART